jgi:D-2-hydroxyacid dehydrogenase (NADP+)
MLWRKKVLLVTPLADHHKRALQERFPGLDLVDCSASREQVAQEIAEAQVVFGHPRPDEFRRAGQLEFIQVISQGVESLAYPELMASAVPVANGKGVWSPPIAEHVVALALAFCRQIPELVRQQVRHEWRGRAFEFGMLRGKTVGMLGTGSIARETVPLFKAFGCRVIGCNRTGKHPAGYDQVWTSEGLHAFLAQGDIIVNSLPFTAHTCHLVDAEAIGCMKRTAVYINVGRGGTTDDKALITALREQRIGGAGLDVVEQEPLPPNSPLWDLPNVIITSHQSGLGGAGLDAGFNVFVRNLERLRDGKPLLNLIDKSAGY